MKISMEKFSPQKVLLGTLIVFFCSRQHLLAAGLFRKDALTLLRMMG